MGQKFINFIKEDFWLLDNNGLSLIKGIFIKALKISVLSAQGFTRDFCALRASALSLYSLLSIVPVIALLFGIAKGFGFEKMLERWIVEQAPEKESLIFQLISFARNLLDNTKGEVVAGIGVIVLFWTIISLIGNIEESFNAIWKQAKGRSFKRKVSDYLSLMLLAPVILMTSSSIAVFLKAKITWLISFVKLPALGTWFVIQGLSLSSVLLMSGLFAFSFIFVPNRKIDYRAGIIAGAVTGVFYNLLQSAYLSLQIGVSSYNAIYGSFAAVPLFVVWLQTGWMIVLFGCEIAFYLQYYESYRWNNRYSQLSYSLKKIIALQLTHFIIKKFIHFNTSSTATEMGIKLGIPLAIIQPILLKLVASHVIVELNKPDEDEIYYQPAVSIEILTIAYVINALEQAGQNQLINKHEPESTIEPVTEFKKLIEATAQNCLLKDI
jgi:membrane protein